MGTLINLRSFLALHVHVCRNNRVELCVSSPFFLVKDAGGSTNQPSDLLQTFDMFDHE